MGILLHVNFADQLYRNTLSRSINNKVVNNYVDWQYYIGHGRRISSKNTEKSLDKCGRIQTSYTRLQANVGQSRRVTRRMQASVDQSLDECRQMQMSVDQSKISTLIPEIVAHGPIFLLLKLCNSRPHRCANWQFYLLLLLMTVFSFPTLAKPICLFNVRELELNWCSKDQSRKMEDPL